MTPLTYITETYCDCCHGAGPVMDALIARGADATVTHRHVPQRASTPQVDTSTY